jgi:hypothetical protein
MSEEKELDVVEQQDGSATVDLPEAEDAAGEAQPVQATEGGEVEADDDDREDIRAARRARRRAKKEYIKRTNEEKDQRLTLLQRQNQELMERLAVIERKAHSSDLARLDKAIEDEELRLQYAQQKMREATDNSDGTAFMKAQEMWYDSRRKVEAMRGVKEQTVRTPEVSPIDPQLKRFAGEWMEDNDWYDPNGADEDSQIAKVIDSKLVSEGWNPATEEYWDELDRRLQKRLPHRYNDFQDEAPRKKPRSVVTGSSRDSSVGRQSGNSFVVKSRTCSGNKEAGKWDNPSERNRMIKAYADYDRRNRG